MKKLTKDIVNKRLAPRRIKLISDYTRVMTKSTFQCEYGHEWSATPDSVLRGSGCPYCAGNAKYTKKSINEKLSSRGITLINDYVEANTKTDFECIYGHHWSTTVGSIMSGTGCPYCTGKAKVTEEMLAERLKGRELYLIGKLIDTTTKSLFKCKCGYEWKVAPDTLFQGHGCPRCERAKQHKKLIHSQEQVINDFKKVHGDKYDYSLVDYDNNNTKVRIICPEHGEFEQTPVSHKNGSGCPKCANNIKLTTKEIIKIFRKIHGDKYDYSKVEYVNAITKVKIICPKHGVFQQTPDTHKSGSGCYQCGHDRVGELSKLSTEEIIKSFQETHGNKYDYSLVKYKDANSKVKIICPEHGEFEQTPYSHKSGAGCPSCASYGFDSLQPSILYYLSINNGQAYKIGITNRTVEERFEKCDLEKIKIVKTWYYDIGQDAYDEEKRILKHFKDHKYLGQALLLSGNSELFDFDILQLDDIRKISKNPAA